MSSLGKQLNFILCIGDDLPDKNMFEIITGTCPASKPPLMGVSEVLVFTVGKKPSKTKYFKLVRPSRWRVATNENKEDESHLDIIFMRFLGVRIVIL
ncbi:Alpha,alpha-trehalose-phosphate synthase [UDP-forming] 5 [Platanthera guangdongensis]|uniref:Alpha,alpha-trehalose-phosphate synthase [UDP-forming] 5 n=1 Tax=Platanthera guangdongensis TaxID=2320717 RepID=A0ABR2MDG1_9ASPA